MAEEKKGCASASTCSKESCAGCASANKKNPFEVETNPNARIKHVIGIVSGKGGVGKSFVTSSLASMMAKAGYKVGILDADITGPSIPKMFGVHGPAIGDDNGTFPIEAAYGTKIMSINLLLEMKNSPVIWRTVLQVQQFWTDVQWGDVDYLFVDMPPGTGDFPLQYSVTSGRWYCDCDISTGMVQMIVKKAYNMAGMMDVPVLGVVENYSYVKCQTAMKRFIFMAIVILRMSQKNSVFPFSVNFDGSRNLPRQPMQVRSLQWRMTILQRLRQFWRNCSKNKEIIV